MAPKPKIMLLELDDRWSDTPVEGPSSVRRFKDSIHDYLPFGPTICTIIDTPQFQRLRHIMQLGTSYYVWPGASHNRFEHCLGVAYLAQTLVMHLKQSQPSLGITQRDAQCVTIAGLCHDLGHGPWSHVWDSMFIPSLLPHKKWCHEDASQMMFDALLDENDLVLAPENRAFVKALIMGDISMCTQPEKPYLFQIVANKTNGLDVDKFDYIARDSHAIDQRSNLSLTRLIYSSKVIDDEICYDIKDAHQVFELCHTRMSLHKRIYTHKTAKAIEYMIVDALREAEKVMHIVDHIEDPKKYLHLTDHIQTQIEASDNDELSEAQKILRRIRVRDLYKSVDFKVFPWHCKSKLQETFTPESVVQAVKDLYADWKTAHKGAAVAEAGDFAGVREEDVEALGAKDVIIEVTGRHHGMGNKNPLDFVKFYSKHNPNRGVYANADDVSVTLPSAFGEMQLRVYTRQAHFFGLVQLGYRQVLADFVIPPPPAEESARAGTEDVETDAETVTETIDLPLELGPEPSPPRAGTGTGAGLGVGRAASGKGKDPLSRAASASFSELGTRPRVVSGRSKSARWDRTASGRVVEVKENVFTKVPPTFRPTSPMRPTGVKRAREESAAAEGGKDAGGSASEGSRGSGGVRPTAAEGELDLELDVEVEGSSASGGARSGGGDGGGEGVRGGRGPRPEAGAIRH
ncbi:hypothetical protein BD413DRAFT_270194 [Trametes elegans]|nr:hypothetical protein BD413DRAFT_270194 [Trametes elegans]